MGILISQTNKNKLKDLDMIDHDRDDYIERKLIHLRSQLIAYQDMIENGHSLQVATDCNLIDNMQLQVEEVLHAFKQSDVIKTKKKSDLLSLV